MEILFVRKNGTRYIIFLKAPSILTNIISNKEMSKEFMVTPTIQTTCTYCRNHRNIAQNVMDNSDFSLNQT